MKKLFLLCSVAILTLSPQDSNAQFLKQLGRSIRNSYNSYSNTSSSNRGLSSYERRIREEQENARKEYEFNKKWQSDTIRTSEVLDNSSEWVRSVDKSMLIEQNTENELGWELKYLTDGIDTYVEGKKENGDFVFFKYGGDNKRGDSYENKPIGSWQITKSNGAVMKFDLESSITTIEYPNGSKIELDAKCGSNSLGYNFYIFIQHKQVSDYVGKTLLGEFAKITTSTGKVIDIRGLHFQMLETYLENVRIGKLNYYFDLETGELVYCGQRYNGKVYPVPESDEIISVDNGKVTMKSGDFYEYGQSGPRTDLIINAKITRNGYTWIMKQANEYSISKVCRDSLGGLFMPTFKNDEVYNKYNAARTALEEAGVIRKLTTNYNLPKIGYKSAHEDFYKSYDFRDFCDDRMLKMVNDPLVKDEIIPLFGYKTKPGGVICYVFEGKEYTEAEVQAILDKVKAEEAAKAKAKAAQDLKIYNANCQKYGKKYVDAEKPIVGMPEEWMLKKFYVKCAYESGTVKRYTMYNIFNNPFGSVWTRNGRVTSVSTW